MLCCLIIYSVIFIDLSTSPDDGDDENTQKKSKTELGHKRNITRVYSYQSLENKLGDASTDLRLTFIYIFIRRH